MGPLARKQTFTLHNRLDRQLRLFIINVRFYHSLMQCHPGSNRSVLHVFFCHTFKMSDNSLLLSISSVHLFWYAAVYYVISIISGFPVAEFYNFAWPCFDFKADFLYLKGKTTCSINACLIKLTL